MKSDHQTAICLPGEDGWELWKQGPGGMHLAQSMNLEEGGSPAAFKGAQVFGYPVVSAFAVPIWAATADPAMLPDIINIQLEKSGLSPDNPVGQLVDTKIVDREETQTLAVASVLNERVVTELPQQSPESFEVSPYLFYLPENAMVIWRELGRLVVCITRQEHPVYYHALTLGELNADAVAEIESMMMPLYMQGIVGELSRVVLWTDRVAEGADRLLADTLHLPVKSEKKPPPAPPPQTAEFEPTAVALEKIRHARLKRVRRIVSACAAVYVLLVAGLVGKHLWQLKTNTELREQEARLKPLVQIVDPTMERWRLTESLRDKDRAPLEIIRRVLEPVANYEGKVRVIDIRIEGSRVEIKGEATDPNRAISYGTSFKTNKELSDYEWSHASGPPRSGIFTFTITGNRKEEENGAT